MGVAQFYRQVARQRRVGSKQPLGGKVTASRVRPSTSSVLRNIDISLKGRRDLPSRPSSSFQPPRSTLLSWHWSSLSLSSSGIYTYYIGSLTKLDPLCSTRPVSCGASGALDKGGEIAVQATPLFLRCVSTIVSSTFRMTFRSPNVPLVPDLFTNCTSPPRTPAAYATHKSA